MVCAGDGSVGPIQAPWQFENWARSTRFSVPARISPGTREQLVAAVQWAERGGRVLKAVGSGWSYPGTAVTPDVDDALDTRGLRAVLSGTDPDSSATLLPFALNDAARAQHRYLLHVEAGITLRELNCRLDAGGAAPGSALALRTLGGSDGQTLAGAFSTGTHGSDVDHPPLADAVRAIHLVGPGGREWWIEPTGELAITDPARMEAARADGRLCADVRIAYDDLLFRAVLVSLGRMGVIYSVVIQAVDAFRLLQTRSQDTWTRAAANIRSEIVEAGEPYTGPRFMEVVVSPYRNAAGEHDCVVTRRVEEALLPPTPDGPPDPFDLFCDAAPLSPLLAGLNAALPAAIGAAGAASVAAAGGLRAGLSFLGPLGEAFVDLFAPVAVSSATAALVALQAAVTAVTLAPGENPAAKLVSLCNLATAVGRTWVVRDLVNAMVGVIRDPDAPPVVMASYRFTGQPACPEPRREYPECMRQIDGVEFAFDATPGHDNLFRFMDDVFALTDEFYDAGRPPGFGISLRFTRGTTALLGMQRFARTCCVEFLMMRGINGHEDFRRRLYVLAAAHGGVPHWGLVHEIGAAAVHAAYGEAYVDWRMALGRLIEDGGGRNRTFSTSFSRERGLEPMRGCLVPAALVDLFRDIIAALPRAARRRRAHPAALLRGASGTGTGSGPA